MRLVCMAPIPSVKPSIGRPIRNVSAGQSVACSVRKQRRLQPDDAAMKDQQESLGATVERLLRQYFAAHSDSLPAQGLYNRVLREVEKPLLQVTLAATRGNQVKAA